MCSDTLMQTALVDLCNTVFESSDNHNFVWYWTDNQLHLKLSDVFLNTMTQVYIYNTSGQLLVFEELKSTHAKLYLALHTQLNNFILVLKSDKRRKVLKISK